MFKSARQVQHAHRKQTPPARLANSSCPQKRQFGDGAQTVLNPAVLAALLVRLAMRRRLRRRLSRFYGIGLLMPRNGLYCGGLCTLLT